MLFFYEKFLADSLSDWNKKLPGSSRLKIASASSVAEFADATFPDERAQNGLDGRGTDVWKDAADVGL